MLTQFTQKERLHNAVYKNFVIIIIIIIIIITVVVIIVVIIIIIIIIKVGLIDVWIDILSVAQSVEHSPCL